MKITKLALNDILYELVSDITIDNTLTTNQDSVPSTALVKTNIDRIDNSVSEVNTQLSTIQSNLSSLQTSVSELNANKQKLFLIEQVNTGERIRAKAESVIQKYSNGVFFIPYVHDASDSPSVGTSGMVILAALSIQYYVMLALPYNNNTMFKCSAVTEWDAYTSD